LRGIKNLTLLLTSISKVECKPFVPLYEIRMLLPQFYIQQLILHCPVAIRLIKENMKLNQVWKS